ncbi:dienelactone hydrolase family protein [Paludibacterium purpuratum]|nr:CocE/NonD family hydrolase [Paludibacterium purpuratum]
MLPLSQKASQKSWQNLLLALSLILCGLAPAMAADTMPHRIPMITAGITETVVTIPMQDEGVSLQATVFKPQGAGPFPLVIINHGADGHVAPAQQPRFRYNNGVFYFLARGYLVVQPMMRGYAGSQGVLPDPLCHEQAKVALASAKDIHTVIDYMLTQANVDPAPGVIVAGQSFGGWNTLAYGTLGDTRVKALVNFAGGLNLGHCPRTPWGLVDGAGTFGAQSHTPSLWFYGNNDSRFPPATSQRMYRAYTERGGQAKLVNVGDFMNDSHNYYAAAEGIQLWAPILDDFLASQGLPHDIKNPQYMPTPFPSESQYAALNDTSAIPYVNEFGRKAYQQFLKQPFPRVFAVSKDGTARTAHGGFDPVGFLLNGCKAQGAECELYAVDDRVVWRKN